MRLRVAQVLLAAAAIAAVLSGWAFFTGGFKIHVGGIPVSVRGADRAAFVALVCAVLAVFLHEPLRAPLARADAILQSFLAPLLRRQGRVHLLPVVAVAAAILVFGAGTRFGTRAAGGADTYGYVSQVELWRKGDLHVRQDFARSFPWPNAAWTFCPLGYRPADDDTIVPTYPPGLPLLMLPFSIVFGKGGVYYVPWLAGAALVLLTYALGTRIAGRAVGATAAVTIASNPTVLMLTFSAMSDVPVATLWTASLLAGWRGTLAAAALSGVTAGLAVLVRPNLVVLAIVPLALAAWPWRSPREGRAWLSRAATFTAAFLPFPLFIGWLFDNLYGSPFTSGYGDNSALFAWSHVATNLVRYPAWLWTSQGPFVFLFLLAPLFVARRDGRGYVRAAFLAFIALVFALYLVYLPFDAWWYTRFLLPAYPPVFVLAAEAVWLTAERFGATTQRAAGVLFALVMLYFGAGNSYYWGVHRVGDGAQKFADIGDYVNRTLPKNAIVITMQHSGTVRHYSDRLTVRYDYIEPEWLDRTIAHLLARGYEPVLMLEDWEVPEFRRRFASQAAVARVAREPAYDRCAYLVYVFRLVEREGAPAAERIPVTHGCE